MHNALCHGGGEGVCATPCVTGQTCARLVLPGVCAQRLASQGGGPVRNALCHGRACAQRGPCAQRLVNGGG